MTQTETSLRRHMTSWHEKLTLSLALPYFFFFIGAPLGGIIRKGGFGHACSSVRAYFYHLLHYQQYGLKMVVTVKWICGWVCGPVQPCWLHWCIPTYKPIMIRWC